MPGLVRMTSPGRLVVSREAVEAKLGRDWETHEFQLAIVSYFGHIQEWDDDEIVIAWDRSRKAARHDDRPEGAAQADHEAAL